MARLFIIVNVDVDPSRVDPDWLAEDIVDTFNDQRHVHATLVDFVSAQWEE